jgi:hypothetical protein
VRDFLEPASDLPEAQVVRGFLEREFLFRVDGEAFLVRYAPGSPVAWAEGNVPDYDQLRCTVIECTPESLAKLLARQWSPSDWLFSGDVYLSGMASAMAYNHGFLRLLRLAQETQPSAN